MRDKKQTERAVFEQRSTIESWDRDYYHPIAECYYDQAILAMLRIMEVEGNAQVLDAGCGPGVHAIRVARAGNRVCAVDFSETMLQEAQLRVTAAGLTSSVEFREEDLTHLTFPDNSFRYVFSWGVIIHIRDVKKALRELARVIEPGGKLAIYITNRESWDQKLEWLLRLLLHKPVVGRESHQLGNGIWYTMNGQKLWVWQFDIPELEQYLETCGLQTVQRVIGEFTEIQRRVAGPVRRMLLRWNNLCYRFRFPPALAATNLLVFRKNDRGYS
jgi:ubiquinone/menaquinone biosynthesis C-methylase UbiE